MIDESQKKALDCCSEVHLVNSGLAQAVYSKIGALTRGGEDGRVLHGTLEKFSELFGKPYNSIWRAVKSLCATGWLEQQVQTNGAEWQIRANAFQSKQYRWVSHEEWVQNHPGQCYEGLKMPWAQELNDPLAVLLWNVSGGKTRWYAYHLACLRNGYPNLTDEEIAREWKGYLSGLKPPCVFQGQWVAARNRFTQIARSNPAKRVI